MLLKQYFLAFSATAFLALLPNQPSFAFSIQNSQAAISSFPYSDRLTGLKGVVNLDAWPVYDRRRYGNRGKVVEIKRGGTELLLNLLKYDFSDWKFEKSDSDLKGSFTVQDYFPCIPRLPCGQYEGVVGALINIKYNPKGDDPVGDRVHWIQRVTHNLDLDVDETNKIDLPYSRFPIFNPYYDTYGKGNWTYMQDTPNTIYSNTSHYFYAETYLVEEIAPQTVKIYNGVRWGFENKVLRRPNACPANAIHHPREYYSYSYYPEAGYYGGYCEDPETGEYLADELGTETGLNQDDAILASATEDGWERFENVPTGRWYDPPTTYGFEFQALGDTLFDRILDFPILEDDSFTVSVGDQILGEFGAGDSIDFVSLFGQGVSSFKITNIDTQGETDFPIKLAFNEDVGSFQMRPFPESQAVPEPSSVVGTLALGILGTTVVCKRKKMRSHH